MNAREKRMVVILGVLLAVAFVFGGYLLVYSPWSQKKELARKLSREIEEKTEKSTRYLAMSKQADVFKSMSLPTEVTTARQVYDILLGQIIEQSGAPKGFTVTPKSVQGNTAIPTLPSADGSIVMAGKEKFAYQKLVSEIKLTKVDLRVLGEFLRAYHALPILHHISSMRITKKDEPGSAATRRTRDRSDPEQWKDLEVLITTEALILDGVEDRKSLVSLPKQLSAVAGSTMYSGLMASSEFGLKLALAYAGAKSPLAEPSASTSRDYAMLVGKDIFHGPIPKEEIVYVPPVVITPKEDISRFIKLNEITGRSDGSAKFEIRDQANNFLYTGILTPKGEKTVVEISKNWFGPSGKPISDYKLKKDLVITDDGKTASNYTFKIVAIDWVGEGLILSGPHLGKPSVAAPVRPANGGNGFGNRYRGPGGVAGGGGAPKLPVPQPNAALAGGWINALSGSSDVLYYLRNGGSIKDMKILQPSDVLEIVRRNSASGLNPYLNADVTLPANEPVNELIGDEK